MLNIIAPLIVASTLSIGPSHLGFGYVCPGDARCPAEVFSLTYKLCATDKYTDGKERTTCDWDKSPTMWVYDSKKLCDSEGAKELSVNYGDWRTIDHERLRAIEYRCVPLMVLTAKDIPAK